MVLLNHDVVSDVLASLWILHTTEWTSEFKPEAFRRHFCQYALISKCWTLSAEVYVFRSACIEWDTRWQSLKSGLTGPRGQALQDCIRVLDVTISHSHLGIPVERLDGIIQLCPKLVELRLRVGPEINTLYLKAQQTTRLRLAFKALSSTLRALQVSFDSRRRKSQVMKQIPELVPLNQLDFVTITWDGDLSHLPTFDPNEWDVRTLDTPFHMEHWPLETNATVTPLNLVQSVGHGFPIPPLIVPTALRVYSTLYSTFHAGGVSPFLTLLGPHLKGVVLQTAFRSVRWPKSCDEVVAACPNLERLLILDCYLSGNGCLVYDPLPMAELYVLEPQDWSIDEPRHMVGSMEQGKTPGGGFTKTRRLDVGEPIQTASHLVYFARQWAAQHDRPVYRKPIVYHPKWPSEAFLGTEETRDMDALARTRLWDLCWAKDMMRKEKTLIALRQPYTALPEAG